MQNVIILAFVLENAMVMKYTISTIVLKYGILPQSINFFVMICLFWWKKCFNENKKSVLKIKQQKKSVLI